MNTSPKSKLSRRKTINCVAIFASNKFKDNGVNCLEELLKRDFYRKMIDSGEDRVLSCDIASGKVSPEQQRIVVFGTLLCLDFRLSPIQTGHENTINLSENQSPLCGDFCLKQIQGQWSELSRRTIEERLLQKNDRLRRRQGSELRHRKWKSFARTTTHRRLRDAPMFGLSIESNTDWT